MTRVTGQKCREKKTSSTTCTKLAINRVRANKRGGVLAKCPSVSKYEETRCSAEMPLGFCKIKICLRLCENIIIIFFNVYFVANQMILYFRWKGLISIFFLKNWIHQNKLIYGLSGIVCHNNFLMYNVIYNGLCEFCFVFFRLFVLICRWLAF